MSSLGRLAGVPAKSATGYRDGYEEARTISYGSTPVTIRRPRVRESEAPFASDILPPYKRRFPELDKTMHELWLQGLSTRDFEPSLRALLGETTPLSPSAISRVNKQFLDDYRNWSQRSIADKYVYLWADGVYLDAGAEQERRVMLVVIGVDTEGEKDLLAIEDAFGESAGELEDAVRELARAWAQKRRAVSRRRRAGHLESLLSCLSPV